MKKVLFVDRDRSFITSDRLSDMKLAKKAGAKGILVGDASLFDALKKEGIEKTCVYIADDWEEVVSFLKNPVRKASIKRKTKETNIDVSLVIDGIGKSDIKTGIGFFDHMLEQIARHAGIDMVVKVKGDLNVDEHHTIEDTAIALGECIDKALGKKLGIERYGFALPMDDSSAQVLIDFGGRSWLVWEVVFKREKIGEMPAEMFYHFFKSFADAAKCNLNIKAEGKNEHHKAEAIFKAFAKAIRMAKKRDMSNKSLPSTKGVI